MTFKGHLHGSASTRLKWEWDLKTDPVRPETGPACSPVEKKHTPLTFSKRISAVAILGAGSVLKW